MIMQNIKGSGFLRINRAEVQLRQVYIPKKRLCAFGGVFLRSFISKYGNLDADLYCKQLDQVPMIFNRKGIILSIDNAKVQN